VDLVDKTFFVRASSGRATPLDVIFVTQRTLRAVPDSPRLRVGPEMHAWIVGGIRFGPVLRRVDMACRGGAALSTSVTSLIATSARDPRSDGKPWSKDHRGLRKRRRVVASGKGAKRSWPQNGMKSNHSFNARSSFGVPLPDQQTVEANQRIIPLRSDPGTPQRKLACRRTTASPLVRQSCSERRLHRFAFNTDRAKAGPSNHP